MTDLNIDLFGDVKLGELRNRASTIITDREQARLKQEAQEATITDAEVTKIVNSSHRCYYLPDADYAKVTLAMGTEAKRLNGLGQARMWPLVYRESKRSPVQQAIAEKRETVE